MNMTHKFILKCPNSCMAERRYVASVLFEEFLGVQSECVPCDGQDWQLTDAEGHKSLVIPDVFLSETANGWLDTASLPKQPLPIWRVVDDLPDVNVTNSEVPIIAGRKNPDAQWVCQKSENDIYLGVDVLGAAFFMLSRYEEAVKKERDEHDRFPAWASLAYQEEFLDRPIIDEYVEILGACIHRLWPGLERKKRHFKKVISCDVDSPYQYGGHVRPMLRGLGGDILKRRSLALAWKRVSSFARWKRGDWNADPHYAAIDWIMDVNEEAGNQVTFFFITDHSSNMDGRYSIDEPCIRALLRRIAERGHEIGLHTSYNTCKNPEQTLKEANILRRVLEEENIQQDMLGARQHYLRWETSRTARNLDAAGIDYDTTLSFADYAGFRCGTCHEYPMYDLKKRTALSLRERPLIVMEGSVINENYMGYGISKRAKKKMERYIEQCWHADGCFTLLWHNSRLIPDESRVLICDERGIYVDLVN